MPRGNSSEDLTTLQMALVGYEIEKKKIEERIREIRGRLGVRNVSSSTAGTRAAAPMRKRVLSAAARRRIAAAQRKRWAEHRRRQGAKAGSRA